MSSSSKVKLSASRLKTAKTCSYLYWAKYHLKLPDKTNDGAARGSVCHLIFESLLPLTQTHNINIDTWFEESNRPFPSRGFQYENLPLSYRNQSKMDWTTQKMRLIELMAVNFGFWNCSSAERGFLDHFPDSEAADVNGSASCGRVNQDLRAAKWKYLYP